MIKGVNKQIVEINDTKNEYVEKAILIINPQKASLPKAVIDRNAALYVEKLLPPTKSKQRSLLYLYVGVAISLVIIAVLAFIWFM